MAEASEQGRSTRAIHSALSLVRLCWLVSWLGSGAIFIWLTMSVTPMTPLGDEKIIFHRPGDPPMAADDVQMIVESGIAGNRLFGPAVIGWLVAGLGVVIALFGRGEFFKSGWVKDLIVPRAFIFGQLWAIGVLLLISLGAAGLWFLGYGLSFLIISWSVWGLLGVIWPSGRVMHPRAAAAVDQCSVEKAMQEKTQGETQGKMR